VTEQPQASLHTWRIEDAGDGLLFLAGIERMPCSSAAVMGKLCSLTLCDRQEGG
jgi:hypothetical protein